MGGYRGPDQGRPSRGATRMLTMSDADAAVLETVLKRHEVQGRCKPCSSPGSLTPPRRIRLRRVRQCVLR